MSTATINSSDSNALSSCAPLGVDKTGLPATVTIALIWPSPVVKISSAMTDTGYSPIASGDWRTREYPCPIRKPLPLPDSPRVVKLPAAGKGNITPPALSKLPVIVLITSISQDAVVPKVTVVVPIRPYTIAVCASHSSPAIRRIVVASMPTACATASGVNGASTLGNSSNPATCERT